MGHEKDSDCAGRLDTRETAESLGLTEENVKVRLHRARALMRG